MIYIKNIKKLSLIIILILLNPMLSAQVGVKTNDPKTYLDINGAISLREGPEIVLTNGDNNNIKFGSSPYSFYKITGPTTFFNINGIVPLSGVDGQIVVLQNVSNQPVGSQIMYVINESNSSTATNRILLPGQSKFMVRGKYATITLQYSVSQSRWLLLNNFNRAQTYYTPPTDIPDGLKTTLTISVPDITATSGVTVSLVNNSGLPDSEKFNLNVEYVEAQNGIIKFRVNNKNPDEDPRPPFNTFVTVQYALTYFIN